MLIIKKEKATKMNNEIAIENAISTSFGAISQNKPASKEESGALKKIVTDALKNKRINGQSDLMQVVIGLIAAVADFEKAVNADDKDDQEYEDRILDPLIKKTFHSERRFLSARAVSKEEVAIKIAILEQLHFYNEIEPEEIHIFLNSLKSATLQKPN